MAGPAPDALLLQLYHHVVLPRDVPGEEHRLLARAEDELVARLTRAIKSLAIHAPAKDLSDLDALRLTLSTCKSLHVEGRVDKNLLLQELRALNPKQALILHITEQNAALHIYRHTSIDGMQEVIFEAFETSPTCEKVLDSEGALQWDFPGQAVTVPYEIFLREDFQHSLSTFLEQASFESIKQFAAVTHKACAPLPEIRDTPNPTLITDMLMTILETVGSKYKMTLLRKRVRDTVSFNNAHKPWRRSAFYLVLRVAMQRHLYALLGAEKGRLYYKVTMCVFLGDLLNNVVTRIPDEATHSLRQKLGRRLAKLEVDHDRSSHAIKDLHCSVFKSLSPVLEKSLLSADRLIASQWETHKRRTTRIVRPINRSAALTDVQLRLPNSSSTLRRALDFRTSMMQTEIHSAAELLGQYTNTTASKPFVAVLERYLPLTAYEEKVTNIATQQSMLSNSASCVHLASQIKEYISTIEDAYLDYPEFKSRQLLKLMELWKAMDEYAVLCYPLLKNYHPGFEASMLDVLELPTFDELKRLRAVQTYLSRRCKAWKGCGSRTIFDTPAEDSFAACYYEASGDSTALLELHQEIEEEAEKILKSKETEWEEKSEKHESKVCEMAGLSCVYFFQHNDEGVRERVHQKPCLKHKLKWEAKQIKIKIIEHPLPSSEPVRKAIIFELRCPAAFAAYRDATWLILSRFGYPDIRLAQNVPLLRGYPGLSDYANETRSAVTLGSSTKSHLSSHYKESAFPVPFRDIHRAFGLKLDYYDTNGSTWTVAIRQPSFAHLFPMKLPSHSPFSAFEFVSADSWPSSNSILATQARCPTDVSVHEYMAWQGLFLGTHSRWPCLLREMGSTNINFSTESTWAIVTRLVLQAGPASSRDILRDVHAVFKDDAFCEALLGQIDCRLDAVRRNWREPVQLDLLLTMLLKAIALTSSSQIRTKAAQMILKARTMTAGWCASLQSDDVETGSASSAFATWAAVLYKRTFYPFFANSSRMTHTAIKDWMIASITLQNSLVGRFDVLPHSLRSAILRDLALAYSFRFFLHQTVCENMPAVLEGIKAFWPVSMESLEMSTTKSAKQLWWWIVLTLPNHSGALHHIHYGIIDGTLLIDGQQLGVLPLEFRRWPIVEELFGSSAIHAFPSPMPGMSVVVSRRMPYDHRIHLGFRDKHLVVRADQEGSIIELIDRNVFRGQLQQDLPGPLLDNCYHWLNLNTGVLEIRQQDPWKSKRSNWQLNLTTRKATRNNGSQLVDPTCGIAVRVFQNFKYFEYPHNITVYQPRHGNLRVEIKRLELDFVVTKSGLLHCPQLGAVIAESRDQDVGTWYGLNSKLVLHSIQDPKQRSILLPLGELVCVRSGPHVAITIKNRGEYLKFTVNEVLGRIDCPAEPFMMYHRALWHALTAHFLPDPLTRRTGVEEALNYLRSGAYQPWTTLAARAYECLLNLAKLSPERTYYPSSLKVMESIRWDENRTAFMQDDRYRREVKMILQRNAELLQFAPSANGNYTGDTLLQVAGNEHLENRALSRTIANVCRRDKIYKSRDTYATDVRRSNVGVLTEMLGTWSTQVNNTTQLMHLLEQQPIIGGYVRPFDKVQITDILETDVGVDWGALITTLRASREEQKFEMIFLLAVLGFSNRVNMDLLRVIASFALLPDLQALELPGPVVYSKFRSYEDLSRDMIFRLLKKAEQPYVPARTTPQHQHLSRQLDHEDAVSKACKKLAESIRAQWPAMELNTEELIAVKDTLLDWDEAIHYVLPEWSRLTRNFLFSRHIDEVQRVLHKNAHDINGPSSAVPPASGIDPEMYPSRVSGGEIPELQDLLTNSFPPKIALPLCSEEHVRENVPIPTERPIRTQASTNPLLDRPPKCVPALVSKISIPAQIKNLTHIVAPLKHSSSMVQRRYGAEMEQSIKALAGRLSETSAPLAPFNPTQLEAEQSAAIQAITSSLGIVQTTLRRNDSRAKWLTAVGLWPTATVSSLLTELRSTSTVTFGEGMKETLVNLGLAITKYQRLLRIQDAADKGRMQQILEELRNLGHTNWSPMQYTDWLLLEIEANILIRPEQVDVALATITPLSGQNSVLQLLMGKGKTSCILPMVALVLTKRNLFRIVLPRPLLLQSAQILQGKLGGLLDRQVLHIPFSRKTPTNKTLMQSYCRLHNEIKGQSGIILALPEHLLSFKLSGLQRLCDGKIEEAASMIKMQDWLDRNARDVLDECDVSLAIRTQLIYPSGSQQTVDGHPLRWQTVQAVLDLVASYLDDMRRKFPSSIEIVQRGGYPLLYFLRKDVEDYLIEQLVKQISNGRTGILPAVAFPSSSQNDVKAFISMTTVDAETSARIVELFKEKRHFIGVLYHLRGLFVHRILLSTLKKRWNVQYGLHPMRDPIAVPYQAKGVPSPTAEWGHPDVMIILTCLSFYYEGLSLDQFKQAFEQLAKSDEPSIEYTMWVAEGVPDSLRNYNAINVEDYQQLRELHHYVRYKVCLLNFYLNCFVFPRHAKQFCKKLLASGSDLILFDPTRADRIGTTGFSGTNDTRHQLPLAIKQSDLPQLAHTNAEVLAYLLEDRNREYIRMVDAFNKRLSEEGLLRKLHNPGTFQKPLPTIRILIDAGAQILEHDNRSLAKAWLKQDYQAAAAVYFNEDHRAMVLYGKGTDIPLVASPFAENLNDCVVYIDESHCRGTDLKLPADAKAAVTLGPHLTKDALVQAAMRLRLLGKTQSVVFFSPPEVHQSILDLRAAAKASSDARVTSFDVIRWLFAQTCNAIEQLEPLYYNQGINYLQRTQARIDFPDFIDNASSREACLNILRSNELQTLKQLYAPKHQQRVATVKHSSFVPALRQHAVELIQRKKDFQDGGFAVHASALEEVEQEREVEFEVESVREVQPPVHFQALRTAKLHTDIKLFALSGKIPAGSDVFLPMFSVLQKTALGKRHGAMIATTAAPKLYVSAQFIKTVEVNETNDGFLRPCHWLLWSCKSEVGLLVSPEEADELIPVLRPYDYNTTGCHLIVYNAPITRQMLHFNDCSYYAIPNLPSTFEAPIWLKVELGLFSGRLYFNWNEYEEIMSYLGAPVSGSDGVEENSNAARQPFVTKSLAFLHDWIAIRRKGQDFEHTPMGFITTGKPLSATHLFFSKSDNGGNPDAYLSTAPGKYVAENSDDESDDGDDHAKEHLFQHDDVDGVDVFHDAEEEFDDEENMFFDGGEYVHEDETEQKEQA